MSKIHQSMRGRGSANNPANRFDKIDYVPDEEEISQGISLRTEYYKDASRSIIAYNDSPDVGFDASINPYRGCEHGCIYCYARPTHEYFGLSLGLDFETKIFVKENAPSLLRKELSSPKWKPQAIALSGNTDPYQPAERHFQLTRECLRVLSEFRNPVAIVTKNFLVTRDIDILKNLSEYGAALVAFSVTTLDPNLARAMEPRASQPEYRLKAIQKLSENSIPTMVMVAPVIPGLTDHEIPNIIRRAVDAGAEGAGYIMLRLPHGVKDLFQSWLETHYPNRKNKVLNRILSIRRGNLNSNEFYDRMKGNGIFAEQIRKIFELACRKAGIEGNKFELSKENFRRPGTSGQLKLFD
jgi:DNA repair photolyase